MKYNITKKDLETFNLTKIVKTIDYFISDSNAILDFLTLSKYSNETEFSKILSEFFLAKTTILKISNFVNSSVISNLHQILNTTEFDDLFLKLDYTFKKYKSLKYLQYSNQIIRTYLLFFGIDYKNSNSKHLILDNLYFLDTCFRKVLQYLEILKAEIYDQFISNFYSEIEDSINISPDGLNFINTGLADVEKVLKSGLFPEKFTQIIYNDIKFIQVNISNPENIKNWSEIRKRIAHLLMFLFALTSTTADVTNAYENLKKGLNIINDSTIKKIRIEIENNPKPEEILDLPELKIDSDFA